MEELIEEGARVHSETRGAAEQALRDLLGDTKAKLSARVAQVRGQAGDALDNLEKIFQTRVHRALTQLGVPSAEEVEALSSRVEALNNSIEQLNRGGRKTVRTRAHTRHSRKAATSATAASAPSESRVDHTARATAARGHRQACDRTRRRGAAGRFL